MRCSEPTSSELAYAFSLYDKFVPEDAKAVLKLTRSGKSYGQYGGASVIHHALTVIVILGSLGVGAGALYVMFGETIQSIITTYRPCSSAGEQIMRYALSFVDQTASCIARQENMNRMIVLATGAGGLLTFTSASTKYNQVLAWVEENLPLECLHPRNAAPAGAPAGAAPAHLPSSTLHHALDLRHLHPHQCSAPEKVWRVWLHAPG
jgi:hypothetical protein